MMKVINDGSVDLCGEEQHDDGGLRDGLDGHPDHDGAGG